MFLKSFSATLFIALIFTSCNSQSSVKNLGPDDFQTGIAKPNAQIVDVRTPEEFSEKHIPGAVNINVDGADFKKQLNALDKSKPLYVYCLAGSRSKKAANLAVKDGFTDVSSLENGINAWMASNKPVVTSSGEAPKTGMSFDDYLAHIKNPDKLVLVDFNAVWCGPCKMLKPIVTKQINENSDKVELIEIDVDKNPKVASTMNITGIPLLILYKQGREVWRSMGLIDENELAGKLKQFTN
jgi:thioredoxin